MNSRRWLNTSTITMFSAFLAMGVIATDVFASDHGGAPGVNPLNPLDSLCRDTALWTLVTFLIVLTLLWKFAWGPIMEGLDKREKYVFDQRSDAEKANEEAKALLEQYKAQLAQAKAEIQQMQDSAKAASEHACSVMMEKVKADIQAEKRAAQQEIASATTQAQKELAAQSADLAVQLAGNILKQKLDPKAHRQLIDQAVARFGK
ncbi:MAG: F0F1 ATP synthase subunit B [Planctomycetia bacterium]|nr:F0F1 ATP synthase subunit B [Planctomycetia bacterium]